MKVLYAILALSFVIFFVTPGNTDRVDVVAEVHGHRITRRDLDNETALLQRRFQELLQGAALPRGMDLRGRALDQLIDQALLQHEADRLGLDVTDDEVVAAITAMPELQENGRFNRELLERVLQLQRDRGEFEAQVRQDILNQRLRSLIIDGVQVSDPELADRYKLDREQVDLRFVRIGAAELAKTVTPTDEELTKFLGERADAYRSPEKVRVRYVVYTPKDFAALAAPTDEAVTAYYEGHVADRFTDPEEVRARHILVPLSTTADEATREATRAKAADLLAKVKAGGDFAALAKDNSGDPGSAAKGGDLGFFPRGRMVPQFDDAAFALDVGAVSDVVESPFGFHIIKVEEKKPGGPKPLAEVRDAIVKTLTDERALELAREQAEADRRQLVRGKSLKEAVGERPVQETPPFAATDEVPGVGRVKPFADAAFALGIDEPSDLIESEDAIYVLEPIEKIAPAAPPLDEVRDRVAADVQRERGEALAKEKAEALRKRAAEVGLDKAAAEIGATPETTGLFERRAGAAPKLGAPGTLRTDAFALTTEKPLAPQVYTAGGDAIVVDLAERKPADMAALETSKDTLRQQLLTEKQQQAVARFMEVLKDRARQAGALEVNARAVGEG